MARRRKKDQLDELFKILPAVIVGLLIYILGKTLNLKLVIIIYFIVLIVIFGLGFFLYKQRQKKLLASGIDQIDQMSGKMFELLLLELFRKFGYRGKTTEDVADYGADLLLVKNSTKYVVQAKRWKQKVGIEAVQQIVGAIRYYGADRGIVITNSYFTKNAENLARSNKIILWNRNKLIEILSKYEGRHLIDSASSRSNLDSSENLCPQCGNELIVRDGKRGKFIGCTAFPRCRFTKNYTESY